MSSIFNESGLIAFEDHYNILRQGSKSISLTKEWFYALPYADMHSYYLDSFNRTYSMERFVSSKIIPVWSLIEQEIFDKKMNYEEVAIKIRSQKWGASVNRSTTTPSSAFLLKSDIKSNFPVIIGVDNVHEFDILPSYLSSREARSERNISLSSFTNLQVPRRKRGTVKLHLLLKGKKLPVFAIEDVEKFIRFKQKMQLYFIICILIYGDKISFDEIDILC